MSVVLVLGRGESYQQRNRKTGEISLVREMWAVTASEPGLDGLVPWKIHPDHQSKFPALGAWYDVEYRTVESQYGQRLEIAGARFIGHFDYSVALAPSKQGG